MKSIFLSRSLVTGVVLLTIILFACTNSKTEKDDKTNENKMGTIRDTGYAKKIIPGPSGALYIDDGGQAGLPVVLVHSFGGSSAHWQAQLEHLRSNHRSIAFDLRGHGQSALPGDSNYNVQSFERDISSVVDNLQLKKFVLVGHSMGGSAVIEYAMRNPEKVAGLILVGTPGKSKAAESKPIIESLESDNYQKVMDDYMNKLLTNAKPEVATSVRKGMRQISRSASISIIKSVFEFDPLPPLSDYPGPKLIISASGEDQPNALFKQMPDIPHKVITGTSHWVQIDKPEEFNKLLDNFLLHAEKKIDSFQLQEKKQGPNL